MPDKFGNPLRAGDRVLFTTVAHGGLQEGVLKYDEEDRIKYHIIVDHTYPDGRVESTTKHYTRLDGNNHYIINVALYVKDQLDSHGLDLIR